LSIRIYALAKQLKIESKALVDICKKLGFEGKASALASLTDEEVAEVKKEIASSSGSPSGASPGTVPLIRPSGASPAGKVPVLKPAFKPVPKPKTVTEPAEPTEVSPEPETPDIPSVQEVSSQDAASPKKARREPVDGSSVVSQPAEITKKTPSAVKEETPVQESPTKPEKKTSSEETSASSGKSGLKKTPAETDSPAAVTIPAAPPVPTPPIQSEHVTAIRREDYISPMRSILNKVPLLGTKKKKPADDVRDRGEKSGSAKSGPMIRLAPVPKASPGRQPKTPVEPAPQKPDMKLPKEAIRAAARGATRPLDEHIRRHEEKQQLKEKGDKGLDKSVKGKKPREKVMIPPEKILTEEEILANRRKGLGGKFKSKEKEKEKEIETVSVRKGRISSRNRYGDLDTSEPTYIPQHLRRQKKSQQAKTTAPRKTDIVIQLPCTVKLFAEQTGLSMAVVIKKLIEFGLPMPVLYTTQIDSETAELLGESFSLKLQVRAEKSLEDEYVKVLLDETDPPESLVPRPPVVTFLGHVDHGKTSLLDRILGMDVVSGERGGITQHIRAYRISTPKGDITFVDTPGHEAFTEMRARGAQCTDIVVLVVAGDDGVMPQTEEAISHAKAAGVPIVVAMNKMDLPGANPDKTLQELAANEILPSEWGGDVEVVKTSAVTGQGIEELLDTLLLIAELREIKANPDRAALGLALESELHAEQGVIAKVLVRNGTLRTGDVVLCGGAYGRVKVMYNTITAEKLEEASPGTPVQLVGLDIAPEAGSPFCVLDDISKAREIAGERSLALRSRELADIKPQITLENLFQRISSAAEVQTLNIIIRADVRGSIEAIRKELGKLEHPEVKLKILQASVGGITEADVQLADASEAIIVGFNVVPDEGARTLAEKKKIQIRRYDIIYNLAADIKAALEGLLKPVEQQKELGRALIQQTFSVSRLGTIAGCRILSGTVERDCRIRVIRDSRIIGDYLLDSLRREKDDAKEVREGYECGIKLRGFNDVKEGDILEAYKIEEIARTF
jgi:translation initiation factor IF-2